MRAVLTIAAGQSFGGIAALTHPAIEDYARQIGADFISINTETGAPHFQKFRLAEFLGIYERILYLDTDIIVTEGCPDVFTIVPPDAFGAWFPNPMIPGRFADKIARAQEILGDIGWVENYFNSGVMVVSAAHRPIFENPDDYTDAFFEQTQINYRVQKGKYRTFDLGFRWNHTAVRHWDTRLQSRFIHYAGLGHTPGVSRVEQIRTDLRALGRL